MSKPPDFQALMAANNTLQQSRRVHRAETPPHILAAIAGLDGAIALGDPDQIIKANEALQTAVRSGVMPWGVLKAVMGMEQALIGRD